MAQELTHERSRSFRDIILLIRQWWRYLLSKWSVIIAGAGIFALLGLAYAFIRKPTYKAELSFALEDKSAGSALGGALGLASQLGLDLGGTGGGAYEGDNLMELFRSQTMIKKALLNEVTIRGKKQALADIYIAFNKLEDDWKKDPNISEVKPYTGAQLASLTPLQDSLLAEVHEKILDDDLIVEKKDKKLSIITVQVNTVNSIFSKHFTEALVKEVSDSYINTKTKKSAANVSILQHQTDSVRRALNGAIAGVALSEDVNPNANEAFRRLRIPSQKRRIDVQANTAILTELVKNLEMAKVSLRRETPLIQVIDRPGSTLKKKKVSVLKGTVIGSFLGALLTLIALTFAFALKES